MAWKGRGKGLSLELQGIVTCSWPNRGLFGFLGGVIALTNAIRNWDERDARITKYMKTELRNDSSFFRVGMPAGGHWEGWCRRAKCGRIPASYHGIKAP